MGNLSCQQFGALAIAGLLAGGSPVSVASGQCCPRFAITSVEGPFLGASVDLSFYGTDFLAIVGIPEPPTGTGSAEVFVRNPFGALVDFANLVPPDGQINDQFGRSVAVDGDLVIVGSPGHDPQGFDDAGAVYAYALITADGPFVHDATLTELSFPGPSDSFGWSVALDGTTAVIGAIGDDDQAMNAGAVHVFARVAPGTWLPEQELLGSGSGDEFGSAVDIEGNVMVVGARLADEAGPSSGAAYVFRRIGGAWQLEDVLTASDPSSNSHFGAAVALSTDIIVVGAPEHDGGGSNAGGAYVFRYNGQGQWLQEGGMLAPCDQGTASRFGWSVAASAGAVLCGRFSTTSSVPAANLFRISGTTWHETATFKPWPNLLTFAFGRSVSLKENLAFVAAPDPEIPPQLASRAYLFALCPGDVDFDESVDINDLLALLSAWGPCPPPPDPPPLVPCPADGNCEGNVDIQDLLTLLMNWGLCANAVPGGTQPLSLLEEFQAAGLTSSDYSAFLNNLGSENYRCWTAHYLSVCSVPCTQPPLCASSDPYRTGRH